MSQYSMVISIISVRPSNHLLREGLPLYANIVEQYIFNS